MGGISSFLFESFSSLTSLFFISSNCLITSSCFALYELTIFFISSFFSSIFVKNSLYLLFPSGNILSFFLVYSTKALLVKSEMVPKPKASTFFVNNLNNPVILLYLLFCKSVSNFVVSMPYSLINFNNLSSIGYTISYVLYPPIILKSLQPLIQGCLVIFNIFILFLVSTSNIFFNKSLHIFPISLGYSTFPAMIKSFILLSSSSLKGKYPQSITYKQTPKDQTSANSGS